MKRGANTDTHHRIIVSSYVAYVVTNLIYCNVNSMVSYALPVGRYGGNNAVALYRVFGSTTRTRITRGLVSR